MAQDGHLTGSEIYFSADDVIVSKTNQKGVITYANRTFLNVSGYGEDEVLGKPHNIIRHPEMPRCIFKMLWDTLLAGREIFAYVVNRTKRGDHYWVLAHVTPSFDESRAIIGFHSNRRVPDRGPLDGTIIPLYRSLSQCERQAADSKSGLQASLSMLQSVLADKGVGYDQFIFSL